MTLTQIKKALYKEKPTAKFNHTQDDFLYYKTVLSNDRVVDFKIPISEVGNTTFYADMEAQLLIRWIL